MTPLRIQNLVQKLECVPRGGSLWRGRKTGTQLWLSSHVLVIYQPGRSLPPLSLPCDRSLSLCAQSLQSCLTLCDALNLGGKIHWRRDRLPTSHHSWAVLVAQLVKNPPAVWETWVWSLSWEGSLEKRMATHSSILAWRIPWTVYSMGSQRVGHDWATLTFHAYIYINI